MELWSENEPAVRIFGRMLTQWRMGPSGPVGLDYNVLPLVTDSLRLKRRERASALEGLAVLEDEALLWFSERRR